MAEGRRRVKERFGIELEPEVQALGPVEFPADWSRRMIVARGRVRLRGVAGRRRGWRRSRCSAGAWVWLRDSSLVAVERVTVDRRVAGPTRARSGRRSTWRRAT